MMNRPIDPKSESFIGGNYFDKYRSRNPIHQWLMKGFLSCAREMLSAIEFESIVDVGCGPGDLASALFPSNANYLGIDIDPNEIEKAKSRYPGRSFQVGSAHELPVTNGSADLVVACEVLEHLNDPRLAIGEIDRITRKWILASVPREPLWRILNFSRGKYWSSFGNTPGHLQHFSRRSFVKKLQAKWKICEIRTPLPWTMVLACK